MWIVIILLFVVKLGRPLSSRVRVHKPEILVTYDNENEPLGSDSHLDGVGSPNLSRDTPHLKPGLRSNFKCPFIPPLHTLGRCSQIVRVTCIGLPDLMWLDANFLEFDYL